MNKRFISVNILRAAEEGARGWRTGVRRPWTTWPASGAAKSFVFFMLKANPTSSPAFLFLHIARGRTQNKLDRCSPTESPGIPEYSQIGETPARLIASRYWQSCSASSSKAHHLQYGEILVIKSHTSDLVSIRLLIGATELIRHRVKSESVHSLETGCWRNARKGPIERLQISCSINYWIRGFFCCWVSRRVEHNSSPWMEFKTGTQKSRLFNRIETQRWEKVSGFPWCTKLL